MSSLTLPRGKAWGRSSWHGKARSRAGSAGCCQGFAAWARLTIDKGAATALRKQNKSLLPAGINGVEGNFNRGDVIDIHDSTGKRIGSGITNYSSDDLDRIKGVKSAGIADILGYEYGDEAVHRDNLVLV